MARQRTTITRKTRTLALPVPRAAAQQPLRATPTRRAGARRPPFSAAFYADLGPPPSVPDLALARLYWMRIVDTIDKEGAGWSRNERTSLRRLEKTWRTRMNGDDHRWLLVGAKAGRLERALEEAVRPAPVAGWGEQFKIIRHSATEEI